MSQISCNTWAYSSLFFKNTECWQQNRAIWKRRRCKEGRVLERPYESLLLTEPFWGCGPCCPIGPSPGGSGRTGAGQGDPSNESSLWEPSSGTFSAFKVKLIHRSQTWNDENVFLLKWKPGHGPREIRNEISYYVIGEEWDNLPFNTPVADPQGKSPHHAGLIHSLRWDESYLSGWVFVLE